MTTTAISLPPDDNHQAPRHAPEPCASSDEVPAPVAPTPTPRTTRLGVALRSILVDLLAHAASAARIVGHLDDTIAVGRLADHVDAIVHELSELLGDPHLIAAPVPIARSTFALDVTPDAVPEHVTPDAPAASCTISIAIENGTRHELVRLSDPDELGIAFADDETTQPHIALSGGAR